MENVDKKNIGLPSRYINALYELCDEAKNLKKITQDFDGIIQLEDYADSMTEVDFFLSRKGEGTDTKYSVQAAPRKKGMTLTIAEEWESVNEVGFDLNELIKGGDPFKPE